MSVLDANTPHATVARQLRESTDLGLPDGWWHWENVLRAHQLLSREYLASLQPYPADRFNGRGVVICAGGHRLFTNGWVCMRMLRHVGCTLPIEFWHLENEIDPHMARLVRPYGVTCVNATSLAKELPRPPRILMGWELKPFALLQTGFREVLLLDADNVAVANPDFLFDTPQFTEVGTVFWPDYERLASERLIWEAVEVPYRDEREVESGQVLIDKAKCWEALSLTMHYNEHSDFYYKHIHGDKCTFQLAWPRTDTRYVMPQKGIHSLDATMCQHDFEGRRLFQHRNMDKWQLTARNRVIGDFWMEQECRDFLRDLAARWNGSPFTINDPRNAAQALCQMIVKHHFIYHRVGHDQRLIEFLPDGRIGNGAAACERRWSVNCVGEAARLTIVGDAGVTCHLSYDADGILRGRWLNHERMPIELIRAATRLPGPQAVVAEAAVEGATPKTSDARLQSEPLAS